MGIRLNEVRVVPGTGIVVVGTSAIAVVDPGRHAPVAAAAIRDLAQLVDADDPIGSLSRSTEPTEIGLWTVRDGEYLVAVRGSAAKPFGDGTWLPDTGVPIWRPERGTFHAVGLHDESRAVAAARGVWAASGIIVGSSGQPSGADWWEWPAEPIAPAVEQGVGEHALPTVEGVLCPNGHVVNPIARFCHVDGLSLENVSRVLVSGPRIPFAGLIVEDRRHVVVRTTVLGRIPEVDPRVASGEATGIVIRDERALLSRAHLMIEIDGWNVRVCDLESELGTFVLLDGSNDWIRLPAGVRYDIPTTARLRLGETEARLTRSDIR